MKNKVFNSKVKHFFPSPTLFGINSVPQLGLRLKLKKIINDKIYIRKLKIKKKEYEA
jgi:hypothetical protein